jgi:hypothetical protein
MPLTPLRAAPRSAALLRDGLQPLRGLAFAPVVAGILAGILAGLGHAAGVRR